MLSAPAGEVAFRLLTTPSSMRWFLERVWGSPVIDETLLSYAQIAARHPGARFAPAAFISGALFTEGIAERYALMQPAVWLAHGVRGEFADYGSLSRIGPPPHWRWDTFGTGAMPQLGSAAAVHVALRRFPPPCGHPPGRRGGRSVGGRRRGADPAHRE